MDPRVHRMAEYFERRNPERAAPAWAALGEHARAGRCYTIAADDYREHQDYAKAEAAYLKAARQYTLAEQEEPADKRRAAARDCRIHLADSERTEALRDQADATRTAGREQAQAYAEGARAMASQTRESFAAIAESIRQGFQATSRALVGGFTALAHAQREAALASAEIVCRGLEQLARSPQAGFMELTGAIREGDLLQALSTYAGLRGVARREAGAADALHHAIQEGIGGLSPAQRESAALNTLKLFDVITRMLPEPTAPALPPAGTAWPIIEGEATRIAEELHRPRQTPIQIIHSGSSRCLLGSGPPEAVLNITRTDGVYRVCTVAQAAMTRTWHGLEWLGAEERLRQGGCPLPSSRGPIQRFLWLKTCVLADGREHKFAQRAPSGG